MPRSGWAREPQLLSLRVWSLCSATREAAIARGPRTAMKSGPRLPQLEKALAQRRGPNTAINKINSKKKKSMSFWKSVQNRTFVSFKFTRGKLFFKGMLWKEYFDKVASPCPPDLIHLGLGVGSDSSTFLQWDCGWMFTLLSPGVRVSVLKFVPHKSRR